MKSLIKIISYFLVFVLCLFLFLPKQGLYNYAQKELLKYKVIISNEEIKTSLFGINLSGFDFYFENIKIAKVNSLKLSSFIFYNTLEIDDIEFLDSFEKILPTPIEKIKLNYSLDDIKNVKVSASSIYGKVQGHINIFEKKIFLELFANDKMKREYSKLLKNMKFVEGKYIYELKY